VGELNRALAEALQPQRQADMLAHGAAATQVRAAPVRRVSVCVPTGFDSAYDPQEASGGI